MEQNNFVWNDELVKEFLLSYNSVSDFIPGVDPIKKEIDKFKTSKQQSVSNGNDWEITEFISSKIQLIEKWHRIAYNDGRLKKGVTVHYDEILKNALAHNLIEQILQVKRLSDNEVFTIGDEISCWGRKGKVESITVIKDEVYIKPENEHAWRLSGITKLQKATPILFTTFDNVPIYEDFKSVLYSVSKQTFQLGMVGNEVISLIQSGHHLHYLYFAKEKHAHEYILFNSPKLSLNDLLSVWDDGYIQNQSNRDQYKGSSMFKRFENLAQSKIKNQ